MWYVVLLVVENWFAYQLDSHQIRNLSQVLSLKDYVVSRSYITANCLQVALVIKEWCKRRLRGVSLNVIVIF